MFSGKPTWLQHIHKSHLLVQTRMSFLIWAAFRRQNFFQLQYKQHNLFFFFSMDFSWTSPWWVLSISTLTFAFGTCTSPEAGLLPWVKLQDIWGRDGFVQKVSFCTVFYLMFLLCFLINHQRKKQCKNQAKGLSQLMTDFLCTSSKRREDTTSSKVQFCKHPKSRVTLASNYHSSIF